MENPRESSVQLRELPTAFTSRLRRRRDARWRDTDSGVNPTRIGSSKTLPSGQLQAFLPHSGNARFHGDRRTQGPRSNISISG